MVMNGASESSQRGFIQTLGYGDMSPGDVNASYKSLVDYIYGLDPSVTLNIANSNWYSDEFNIKSDFADSLSIYYDAEIFESDFSNPATLDALNGWVEEETNGKIKDILNEINAEDVMFLINAIYFKADWTNQFDADATTDLPFTLSNGQSIQVQTMSAEVKHWWAYDQTLRAEIIEIPYGNENYGFTIIMPDDPSAINNLSANLDMANLNAVLSDSVTLLRDLRLPKFQMDFKTDLVELLVDMGMPLRGLDNLFEEDLPLAISKVIHQSFLEVNEEGSEAAAATVVGIELTAVPASTNINKPFVFLIRERNSGTILFSGKLLNPNE
jgi:serpin B